MNSDGLIIPVVEDDQGEGFRDPIEHEELIRQEKERQWLKYDRMQMNANRKKYNYKINNKIRHLRIK